MQKHINNHLQSAWNKYGQKNFSFTILEEFENDDNIFIKEANCIKLLNSINNKIGYNKGIPNEFGHNKPNGGYRKGIIRSKEGYKNVVQINKTTGKFIKIFASTGEAAKEMGYPNNKKIQRNLRGEIPSYKGYVYVYEKDYDSNKNYVVEKNRQYKLRIKSVFQYDTDNNLIKEWKSVDEVINSLTGSKSSLYTAISRGCTYKGFYWARI